MAYNLTGWVETTAFDEEDTAFIGGWIETVGLSQLLDGTDLVSERLFGIPGGEPTSALAANRGLPTYPSESVRRDIATLQHPENLWGYLSHATWREIKSILPSLDLTDSAWRLVFDLLHTLEQHRNLSDDRIRVVVWAYW